MVKKGYVPKYKIRTISTPVKGEPSKVKCKFCDKIMEKRGAPLHHYYMHTPEGKKFHKVHCDRIRVANLPNFADKSRNGEVFTCEFCGRAGSWASTTAHRTQCKLNPRWAEFYCRRFKNRIGKPLSDVTKGRISKSVSSYLSKNKSKHNWSRYNGEESEPERLFRESLEANPPGCKWEQYYIPPESEKGYELDFAFPRYKLAVEVNGNQHYSPKTGKLLPYYVKRNKYFQDLGWRLIELPARFCYQPKFSRKLVMEALKGIRQLRREEKRVEKAKNSQQF